MKKAHPHFWDGLAIESYKTILKSKPNCPKLLMNLGLAYLRSGEQKRAIRALLKAARQKEVQVEVHYHLGTTYEQLGNHQLANRHLQKFSTLTKGQPSEGVDLLQARVNGKEV